MADSYDVVVVGLGALGSAAAMHLARRGRRVLGLERFELGHHRGASHDTSRILRHSYHTPGYVRLTQEAYDDWAQLERWSGEQLVTVVGGLDLFPPSPAIAMIDYTASLDDVGIAYELLDDPEIVRRWPQFTLPSGTVGLFQERGAIVPAGRGTALMQKLAVEAGADLRGSSRVLELVDRRRRRRGGHRLRLLRRRPRRRLRRRLDQRGARPASTSTCRWRPPWSRRRTSPPSARATSRRTTCRCGSGWTTRRSTASPATASRPSRPPRTAAARWSTPRPARGPPTRTPPMLDRLATFMASLLPESGSRSAPSAASTPSPPTATSCSHPSPATSRSSSGSAPRTASSSHRRSAGCSPTWRRPAPRRGHLRRSGSTGQALTDPSYAAHWLV